MKYSKEELPILIGYLPPLGGINKTGTNYGPHSKLINIGDLVYAYASAMLTCGRNFVIWDFKMSAEEVNESFSKVIFCVPCRIAPPPYDDDGYSYEFITDFIERLKIPFLSLTESIQTNSYDYELNFHKQLSKKVIRYLKVISEKSLIVGTRGNYSAEVLEGLGIRNAQPLGCPSLYVNGPTLNNKLLIPPKNPKKIAVCYSNYQENKHSRIEDVLDFTNKNDYFYIEQTFGLITQALFYPGKITASSIYKAENIYKNINPVISLLEKGLIRYFTNYKIWKDFLSQMDFVFGARMHGITPALHAGVPGIVIAHDARVREMCEFFSLPFIAEKSLPKQFNIEFFLSKSDFSNTFKTYEENYKAFINILRKLKIDGNIKDNGDILDYWEPVPNIKVSKEETDLPMNQDFSNLRKQFNIYEKMPKDTFQKIESIENISQQWYISRFNNRQNS
jgi:hypothetical protein